MRLRVRREICNETLFLCYECHRFRHHHGRNKCCEECGNRTDAERPSRAEMLRNPTDDGSPY